MQFLEIFPPGWNKHSTHVREQQTKSTYSNLIPFYYYTVGLLLYGGKKCMFLNSYTRMSVIIWCQFVGSERVSERVSVCACVFREIR